MHRFSLTVPAHISCSVSSFDLLKRSKTNLKSIFQEFRRFSIFFQKPGKMISFSFPPTKWGHINCKNQTPVVAHLKKADTFLRDSVIYEPFSRKHKILKTSSQMAFFRRYKIEFSPLFFLNTPPPPIFFLNISYYFTNNTVSTFMYIIT